MSSYSDPLKLFNLFKEQAQESGTAGGSFRNSNNFRIFEFRNQAQQVVVSEIQIF